MKLFIIWADYDGIQIEKFECQPVELTGKILIPKEAKKRVAQIKRLASNKRNKYGTHLISQIIGYEIA